MQLPPVKSASIISNFAVVENEQIYFAEIKYRATMRILHLSKIQRLRDMGHFWKMLSQSSTLMASSARSMRLWTWPFLSSSLSLTIAFGI